MRFPPIVHSNRRPQLTSSQPGLTLKCSAPLRLPSLYTLALYATRCVMMLIFEINQLTFAQFLTILGIHTVDTSDIAIGCRWLNHYGCHVCQLLFFRKVVIRQYRWCHNCLEALVIQAILRALGFSCCSLPTLKKILSV